MRRTVPSTRARPTAYGDEERRRVAGERGAAKFLAKPVDFDFLKQQLLQLPEAKAMDQQII